MDKLKMAHDWAMRHSECASHMDFDVKSAWEYADAMQAEHLKRKEQEQHEANQKVRGVMAFPSKASMDEFFKASVEPRLKEDWQPDWSVAPDGYSWWSIDKDGVAYWFNDEPVCTRDIWGCGSSSDLFLSAPSHNYKGDWKDSLRERPTL